MRTTFSVLVGGCITGVAVRSVFDVPYTIYMALFVGVVVLLGVGVLLSRASVFLYVGLFILVGLLGVLRTDFAYSTYHTGRVFTDGSQLQATGIISTEPDTRDTHTILYITVVGDKGVRTGFRVKVPSHHLYAYGKQVNITGKVHVPEAFMTETGRVFDYPGYLMKDGIQYELRDAEVTPTGVFAGNSIIRTLLTAKHAWLQSIANMLPEPAASLAGGVIVGAKQSLGKVWLDHFRDTGIIHIVVLSGYNLTLVANAITHSLKGLPQTVRFFAGSVGIASFALMVGGGATVIRASVMAFLGMLAGFIRRRYILLRALLLAGLFMVLWNPFVLLFDTGFQLSFVATAGLILVAPYLERFLGMVTSQIGLRSIVAATIATQCAVLPLLLYHIGTVSVVAPLVNILILPIVPFAMFFGFIGGMLGIVNGVIALPFAYTAYTMFTYMFSVVSLFSALPFAAVTLPHIPWWIIMLMYGVAGMVYSKRKKPHDL